MNRREILLDLRNRGKLKGLKPCFVSLRPNIGKIFNGVAGRFIMTIRDNTLYFQKLSFFLHRLIPGDDFSVNVNRFVEYKIDKKMTIAILYLYDKDNYFLPIVYEIGTKETYPTEDNISRILKELESKIGLKLAGDDYEEGNDTEGKGSN